MLQYRRAFSWLTRHVSMTEQQTEGNELCWLKGLRTFLMFVFFVIFEEMDKKKNLIITLKSLFGKTSEWIYFNQKNANT